MSFRPAALLTVFAALALAGCGSSGGAKSAATAAPTVKEVSPLGDIPDSQVYVTFHPPAASFTVKIPEGWSQTARSGVIRFTDKLNAIELRESAGAPMALAQGRRAAHALRSAKVSLVTRKAGTALRVTYLASAPADAVTGKVTTDAVERYVFAHHGRRVTLTLSGPRGADNVDPWKLVTDSLRWTR